MNINDLKGRIAPTFEKKEDTIVERSKLPDSKKANEITWEDFLNMKAKQLMKF